MLFRQIIHEDLGCASYLVADRECGVAAVVDPQWDIDPYLRLARLHGVRIEHVLETHNHADHVSGHGRLARATGAKIHIHELAEAEYEHEPFGDGWVLELGEVGDRGGPHPRPPARAHRLPAARREPRRRPLGAARRRLAVHRRRRPARPRDRAARRAPREIFRSLHERLLALDDEVEVWPGHLGGSLCGGSGLDLKSSSTIGFERAHNRALALRRRGRASSRTRSARWATSRRTSREIVALNRGPLVDELRHADADDPARGRGARSPTARS